MGGLPGQGPARSYLVISPSEGSSFFAQTRSQNCPILRHTQPSMRKVLLLLSYAQLAAPFSLAATASRARPSTLARTASWPVSSHIRMHYAEVAFGPKPEASEEEVCNVAAACRPWPARYAYKFQTSSLRIWLPTLVSLAAYGFSRRSQLAAGAATAFRFLDSHYVSHPLVTKACTSGAAYLLGDLLAQRLTTAPRWRALDVGRTFRSTFAGFVSQKRITPGNH